MIPVWSRPYADDFFYNAAKWLNYRWLQVNDPGYDKMNAFLQELAYYSELRLIVEEKKRELVCHCSSGG